MYKGVILFILAIVIISVSLISSKEKPNPSIQIPTNSFVNTKPSVKPTPRLKVTELIQFKVPQGWSQEIMNFDSPEPYQMIQLQSPDKAKPCCGGADISAIGVTFKVTVAGTTTFENRYKQLYEQIHNPNPKEATNHDLSKTTVSSYPALSYYYDFEGHLHFYEVWVGDNLWTITISSPSPLQEVQHKNDIEALLSSIQFVK